MSALILTAALFVGLFFYWLLWREHFWRVRGSDKRDWSNTKTRRGDLRTRHSIFGSVAECKCGISKPRPARVSNARSQAVIAGANPVAAFLSRQHGSQDGLTTERRAGGSFVRFTQLNPRILTAL